MIQDVGEVKWQRLPDGRYLGVETLVVVQDNVIHECPFDGGGSAGDRSPRPWELPSKAASVEGDLSSS